MAASLWDGANESYWPFLWFMAKVLIFVFFFIWLRGTLPGCATTSS